MMPGGDYTSGNNLTQAKRGQSNSRVVLNLNTHSKLQSPLENRDIKGISPFSPPSASLHPSNLNKDFGLADKRDASPK